MGRRPLIDSTRADGLLVAPFGLKILSKAAYWLILQAGNAGGADRRKIGNGPAMATPGTGCGRQSRRAMPPSPKWPPGPQHTRSNRYPNNKGAAAHVRQPRPIQPHELRRLLRRFHDQCFLFALRIHRFVANIDLRIEHARPCCEFQTNTVRIREIDRTHEC